MRMGWIERKKSTVEKSIFNLAAFDCIVGIAIAGFGVGWGVVEMGTAGVDDDDDDGWGC